MADVTYDDETSTAYSLVNMGKYLVEVLAIAIVYIATAQVGFLLAIPPGNVTVLWPPSGIALSAMLLLGYRAWVGIWLGSFLVNMLFFGPQDMLFATSAITASSIAGGSTLQALLAAFLYRRVIGHSVPKELKNVSKFMALAALSCLVAATAGAGSLAFAAATPWSDFPYTWFTWWLGDLAGILTVAPPLLLLGYRTQQIQDAKYLGFLLINCAVGLSLIACYNVSRLADQGALIYIGTGQNWLSASGLVIGLLFTAVLAAHVNRYIQMKGALHDTEERFALAVQGSNTGLWEWDLRTNDIHFSAQWKRMLGYEEHEIQNGVEAWQNRLHPEDRDRALATLRAYLQGHTPEYELEHRLRHKDGSYRWVLSRGACVRDATGRAYRMAGCHVDITARKQAEETAFEEKERAQITLASIGDGVITTDATGRVQCLNQIAEHLLGWTSTEAQGLSSTEIFHLVDETNREPVQDPVQSCLRLGTIAKFDIPVVLIRRDGKELFIDHSAAPIRGQDGKLVGAVMTFRDVTAQRQLTQQLTHQATHDALTGLVNRREFERRLELMLKHAKEQHRQHALCYLDLDQFKVVNDTCGHVAGDELLRQVSGLLKTCMRERDTLARLGGDEFGSVLGECPLDQAVRIANRMRELIQDFRFVWEDKVLSVGTSIGVVPITDTSSDVPSLLSAADSACFAAKEQGRNRVYLYRPDDADLEQLRGEMQWVTRLREALIKERFRLYYQPIVPLQSTTEGTFSEILLRLTGEEGETLLPGAFIPAAERYNQMLAIDRWVVHSTLAALKKITPAPTPIRYAINLSGQSLSDAEFLHAVTDQINRASVSPIHLCFEITESVAIANLVPALNFISAMRDKGCCFALDDFGTGLSSFAYLKTLPVDFLKIDGRFVKDMNSDSMNYAMVEAIHRVGHVMNIKTIAEGVENTASLEKLKSLGVDYAQGYEIAKPRPLLETNAL